MFQPPDPGRGIILKGENEVSNSVIEKHEQLLHNDKIAGRETKKVPLSISEFARNYQVQALADGQELPYAQAEKMAKDFIASQVQATTVSHFKASRKVFTVPELPWKAMRIITEEIARGVIDEKDLRE